MKIRETMLAAMICCMMLIPASSVWGNELVETGKTWWYLSFTSYIDGGQKVVIGLTLDEEDEEGWTPCYALDSLRRRVMDVPLARLKEKDKTVWIRPTLGLHNQAKDIHSNEVAVLSTFLGYWNGNELVCSQWMNEEYDLCWNPDSISEFTLYDFNKQPGDLCRWPWSGYDVKLPESEMFYEELGDLEIMSIEKKEVPVAATDEKRTISTFNLAYEYKDSPLSNGCHAQLMEGIGMASGFLAPYIIDVRCCPGFFIAPMSACDPAFSGSFYNMWMPDLYSVEEPDGTLLIINETIFNGMTGAEIHDKTLIAKPSDENIFDLHGRVVINPQPGSVYIRGGKKFVAK